MLIYPADCSGFAFGGQSARPVAVLSTPYRYRFKSNSSYQVTYQLAGGGLPDGMSLALGGLIAESCCVLHGQPAADG